MHDVHISPTADTLSADASPLSVELTRGASIGRYLVLDRVGAGGDGRRVYSAYDAKLDDRRVAIKARSTRKRGAERDTAGRGRLVREAKAMARASPTRTW